MSLFDLFKSKGPPAPVNEFRRSPQELNAAAADVQRAQGLGGDWDVVDDPEAERMAQALGEQAHAAAARQAAERQRRLMELMAAQQRERESIARQERIDRTVMAAATTLRTLAQTSAARWEALMREHSQAQQAVDRLYLEAECWRCGQVGRLPVEDAALLGTWTPPARPAGAHYDTAMQAARQLLQARRAALEVWRQYNDRRLEVEWLRMESCFHPKVWDRFCLERDCEVCASHGVFHARRLAQDTSGAGPALYFRWRAAMIGHSACVKPLIGFNKWVPVEQLTRDQAKAWLRDPQRGHNSSDEWRAYQQARHEWDEKVKANTIRPATHNDSIALVGRANVGTHIEVTTTYGTVTHTRVVEPVAPRLRSEMTWPDWRFWSPAYPDPWKGGPAHNLMIKPGVNYPPEQQDPLSKEPRIKLAAPKPAAGPIEAQLKARQLYWASAV